MTNKELQELIKKTKMGIKGYQTIAPTSYLKDLEKIKQLAEKLQENANKLVNVKVGTKQWVTLKREKENLQFRIWVKQQEMKK